MLRSILLIAALLAAHPGRAAEPIAVVATFSVVGDMLANVGGDHVRINTIVGPDGDCELYQPTVADVAHVAAARAVFLNDLNEEFEPWLEPLLKQAEFRWRENRGVPRRAHIDGGRGASGIRPAAADSDRPACLARS